MSFAAATILLTLFAVGCSSNKTRSDAALIDRSPPRVVSADPDADADNVPLNQEITIVFNKKMDATSFDQDSLVVMRGQFEYLTGEISFDGNSAKFAPASPLMAGRLYRVRVRSSVTDLAGNHMVEDAVWSFRTGDSAAVQQRGISLGAARSFTILAESSVSTTGATEVDGDVGLSPGTGTDFEGFSNTMDESKQFATSEQVSGRMYAAEFAPPTPVNVVKAVRDMNAAYSDAEGRKLPHSIDLGDGSIDGMELTSGLYRWSSSLAIENSLTLRGTSADVWIFQISGDLDIADGAIMTLSGGASCHNVIWQVSGDVNLGTDSRAEGTMLARGDITLNKGSQLKGRALSMGSVSLDGSTVSCPTEGSKARDEARRNDSQRNDEQRRKEEQRKEEQRKEDRRND